MLVVSLQQPETDRSVGEWAGRRNRGGCRVDLPHRQPVTEATLAILCDLVAIRCRRWDWCRYCCWYGRWLFVGMPLAIGSAVVVYSRSVQGLALGLLRLADCKFAVVVTIENDVFAASTCNVDFNDITGNGIGFQVNLSLPGGALELVCQ